MNDPVYRGFLKRQYEEGMELAHSSDLIELIPFGPLSSESDPPDQYVAVLRCAGLVRNGGSPVPANLFEVGIWFPSDYLRRVEPAEVLTWLGPPHVFHPNIRPPYICLGKVSPATSLVELIYRLFDLVTYNEVTMREDDALNLSACAWARDNQDRLPIDRRPLKRRTLALDVDLKEGAR